MSVLFFVMFLTTYVGSIKQQKFVFLHSEVRSQKSCEFLPQASENVTFLNFPNVSWQFLLLRSSKALPSVFCFLSLLTSSSRLTSKCTVNLNLWCCKILCYLIGKKKFPNLLQNHAKHAVVYMGRIINDLENELVSFFDT